MASDPSPSHQSPIDAAAPRICLTCGQSFSGRFCNGCGEKVVEPADRTLWAFVSATFNAYTAVDGRLARSLRTMFARPGRMSHDIARGVRTPYMTPLAMFFVANFVYFLVPILETFNTSLNSQLEYMPYSAWIKPEFLSRLEAAGTTLANFRPRYDAASANWSKLLLVLMVLALFPFVALINHQRSRLLADHLLFSFEFGSFLLFGPTILLGCLLWLLSKVGHGLGLPVQGLMSDRVLSLLVLVGLSYFMLRGARTFYGHGWLRTVLSTVLVVPALLVAVTLYRLLLYAVTMRELLPPG